MSVFSKNPFASLGEDGEPTPAPAPKAAAKPATPAAPAKDVPGSKSPAANGGRGAGAGRGAGGYASRGGPRNVLKSDAAGSGKPVGEGAVSPEDGFDGERRAPSRPSRGTGDRGRGGRGGPARAPRGGRGGAISGSGPEGRKYDNARRSHAGAHGDSEKKVEKGWGAEEGTAELAAEVEGIKDATKEETDEATPEVAAGEATETDAKADAAPAAESKPAAPVEEEDNTKSYDEYLAELAKKQAEAGIAKLQVREVSSGTSELVGSVLKKEEESYYEGAKKEKTSGDKPKSGKKEKTYIEFEGKFAPPSGGERGGRGGARGGAGGDRGGRGGFRGGEGRGGSRGAERGSFRGGASRGGARGGAGAGHKREQTVAVNDEKAFPALGA